MVQYTATSTIYIFEAARCNMSMTASYDRTPQNADSQYAALKVSRCTLCLVCESKQTFVAEIL